MDELNTEVQGQESTATTESTDTSIATAPSDTGDGITGAPKTLEDIEKLSSSLDEAKTPKSLTGLPGALNETPAAPAFTPNFKYKVYGQEKELDPRLQSIIKSKEDQEWVTKIMSKADGIDGVLAQRDQYRTDYQGIVKQGNAILSALDKKDYNAVFESLGAKPTLGDLVQGLKITDDELIKLAYQRALLTDEQKVAYSTQSQLESQNRDLQLQSQQYQADIQRTQVIQLENDLSNALSSPEIAPISEAYDAHHGQGAFWEEVRLRGIAHFHLNKVDAPLSQLVRDTASRFSPYARSQAAPAQMAPAQSQPAFQAAPVAVKGPQRPPVIPTVTAGGTSPAKKAIRSVADLENAYNELD